MAGNPLNAADPEGLKGSGLDKTDPNYCWKLLQKIRDANRELSHRYDEQERFLDQMQWLPFPLTGWAEATYLGHRAQFYEKQDYLQSLVDEWNGGDNPCGPLH